MQLNISFNQFARYYVNFSVFLFLALSVAFKGSYAISGAVITSTYLLLLSAQIRSKICLSKVEKCLIGVMLIYLASMVLEVVVYGIPLSRIDPQGKVILFIPFILVLNAVRIEFLVVAFGSATGALGLFLLVMFEKYYLGYARAGNSINAIQLGNIALSIGLFTMLLAPVYYIRQKKSLLTVLLVVAGMLGVIASIYTQTRGGLIFMPLLILMCAYYYKREVKSHGLKILVVLAIVLPPLTMTLLNSENLDRFKAGFNNAEHYFEAGNADSSIGIRLELWKVASIIASENPFFGVGYSRYMQEKQRLIARGEINQSALPYNHSHNAYFNAVARRGGAGLLILLLLLLYPIYVGHKQYKNAAGEERGVAVALVIFGWFFIFANLTQTLFAHNSGMIIYLGMLIIIIALMTSTDKSLKVLN